MFNWSVGRGEGVRATGREDPSAEDSTECNLQNNVLIATLESCVMLASMAPFPSD